VALIPSRFTAFVAAFAGSGVLAAAGARAEPSINKVDPSVVVRQLPPAGEQPPANDQPATIAPAPSDRVATAVVVTPSAIVVDGNRAIESADYAAATKDFIGRRLDANGLRALAHTVGDLARSRGYVFATASIPPQDLAGGTLHVEVDEGQVDAVRALGAHSPAVDRILTQLVTHQPLTKAQLERALLLAGDVPGISITETRYLREDGFGILLVTIRQDKFSAFGQIDNRGTHEIGPIRSVLGATAASMITSGDQVTLITAQTPTLPYELAFVSARYEAPVSRSGTVVALGASFAATRAGGSLRDLKLKGQSYDVTLSVTQPLIRSRQRSLWARLELRRLRAHQWLLGDAFQHDRLTTLTAAVNGEQKLAGGTLRAELAVTAGLPLASETRARDTLKSREDGSGRFVLTNLSADWIRDLGGNLSVKLAAAGQFASRPLLSSMEIDLGGSQFGRAYDSSEYSGDQGAMGSVELRYNVKRSGRGFFQRFQIYGFVDGGIVSNLRRGDGGGSLASAGAGIRLGKSWLDTELEVAMPIADQGVSRRRSPRVSFRLIPHF
jgi:hemolysin activation/secretion protein